MNYESTSYLTFALGDEKFAIPVEHVQEVIEFGNITKVPHAPAHMLGILNLRGNVLPVIDTRVKLGLTPSVRTQRSRVLVLDLNYGPDKQMIIGATVDAACEVTEINPSQIQATPEDAGKQSAVSGILNNGGNLTMLMDLTRIFSNTDFTITSNESNSQPS